MTQLHKAIREDLLSVFHLTPTSVTPVVGGYLNQKFRLDTRNGRYLLKQFSPERYPTAKLGRIEQALQRQKYLYENGISCPRVYDVDGRILRHICRDNGDITYVLMSFEEGDTASPQTVTPAQMTALGEMCARMHNALSILDPTSDPYYPLDSAAVVHRIREHHTALKFISDFHLPEPIDSIIASLDVPFFDVCAKQLCHEDFSADNLLFDGNSAIILDFDRGQYSYPLHDVGRALLSLAYDEPDMRMSFVNAFAAGYNRHRTLTKHDLAKALRLTFALEFSWWIHPSAMSASSPKVSRFVREMFFLIHNWNQIPDLLQGG